MTESHRLPEREELIAELQRLRERGLGEVHSLHLFDLHQATRLTRLATGDQVEQEAIAQLLRDAVKSFEGSRLQRAAEYTFGLVENTRSLSAKERREKAADCLRRSVESVRKNYESRIYAQTAEGILALCRAAIRQRNLPVTPTIASWVSDRSTAVQLEARYDGKDPRGVNGRDSRCADPPPSEPLPSSRPPVIGPDGRVVGMVELRTSPICPVIWARVLWTNAYGAGDPNVLYQIPAGWTLHVIAHRPDTQTSCDAEEPSRPTPVPYALSYMLTAVRGCVYVEVYFSNEDGATTPPATTSCLIL